MLKELLKLILTQLVKVLFTENWHFKRILDWHDLIVQHVLLLLLICSKTTSLLNNGFLCFLLRQHFASVGFVRHTGRSSRLEDFWRFGQGVGLELWLGRCNWLAFARHRSLLWLHWPINSLSRCLEQNLLKKIRIQILNFNSLSLKLV